MANSALGSFENAIKSNDINDITRLLEAGYDPNARPHENGLTPLHLAAWYDHPKLIELLVDHGAKVHQKEELTHKTPLHIAAYFGHLDCCKVLIEKKSSTHQDIASFIPLHYAALRGHVKTAELLSENAKSLLEDSICGAAIDIAIRHRNIELIDYFLTKLQEYFSPPNSKSEGFSFSQYWKKTTSPVSRWDPLHFATLIGAKDIVQLLLTKKSFLNVEGSTEFTPLHLAAQKGHSEIVELLLSDFEYDRKEDMYHSSPLELAVLNGHLSTVEVFVKRGFKPWLIDKVQLIGDRPTSTVSAAVWDGKYQKLQEILEHEGKEVLFEKDERYRDPPLQMAILSRQTEIGKLFIEYGGKELIRQTSSSEMTALHRAAFHGVLDLYQLILHVGGVDLLKQTCETFGTPLDCALRQNHIEIVEWTLSQPQLDFSFEELFITERDSWALMDLNPKIGGYFMRLKKELGVANT